MTKFGSRRRERPQDVPINLYGRPKALYKESIRGTICEDEARSYNDE